MRLSCPYCGERDSREFSYRGHALVALRPEGEDWSPEWDDYLHNRENPAGWTEELWYHAACGTWFVAERNTVTHAFRNMRLPGTQT
ncbi:MAG: sarcosine oxidase subunit delta [Pseudomonadota bacterium]